MDHRSIRRPAADVTGSRRRRVGAALVRGVLAVLGTLVLLAAYGVFVEPRLILDDERYEVAVPGLAAGAPPLTVAAFSDLQVGMWFANEDMVSEIVDEVVAERPSASLLGGDVILGREPPPTEQIERVTTLLAPLTAAGIPTYAVLGNHDYQAGAADRLAAALERTGVVVLRNGSAPVPGGAGLHVVGVGPDRPDRVDVDAALDSLPEDAPRVVLMHNPTTFLRLPPGSAPLAVAGHTHCGQVAVPGLAAWSWFELTAGERVVTDGWAPQGYGATGNALFVTCGIGFSVVPMRIAAPPQVAFFELTAGERSGRSGRDDLR